MVASVIDLAIFFLLLLNTAVLKRVVDLDTAVVLIYGDGHTPISPRLAYHGLLHLYLKLLRMYVDSK